jgi:hypothetical protein
VSGWWDTNRVKYTAPDKSSSTTAQKGSPSDFLTGYTAAYENQQSPLFVKYVDSQAAKRNVEPQVVIQEVAKLAHDKQGKTSEYTAAPQEWDDAWMINFGLKKNADGTYNESPMAMQASQYNWVDNRGKGVSGVPDVNLTATNVVPLFEWKPTGNKTVTIQNQQYVPENLVSIPGSLGNIDNATNNGLAVVLMRNTGTADAPKIERTVMPFTPEVEATLKALDKNVRVVVDTWKEVATKQNTW